WCRSSAGADHLSLCPISDPGGLFVEPPFKLPDRDQTAAAAVDEPYLRCDVLREEVAADAERGGCLARAESNPRDRCLSAPHGVGPGLIHTSLSPTRWAHLVRAGQLQNHRPSAKPRL